MIPFKATVVHNPSVRSFGDCFRTVIASILDTDPAKVPHFFEDGNAEIGFWRCDVWLASEHNLHYVETRYPAQSMGFAEFLQIVTLHYPGLYLIVGGSNGHGDHVSIYLDGVLINDPNQYGEGLTGPTSHDYYSIGFLVSGKHKP